MVWNIETVDDAVYYVKYMLEHNKDILNQYNYFNYEAFISIFDEMGPNNTDFQIKSGASKGETVATITREQLREIAETKLPDLNAYDVEAAMKIVEGTARNMGIKIEE